MVAVRYPSVQSLFIKMYFNDTYLSSGTAFVIENTAGLPFLITNRHNVTGRDQITNECMNSNGAIPNKIHIYHIKENESNYIEWFSVEEELLNNNHPLWREHPVLGPRIDFVALPLTRLDNVKLCPYDLNAQSSIPISPTEMVSVVGFPFGIRVGGSVAIWSTGFIASEPDMDYGELPCFLIDCRSRQGQSGSPVIAHRNNGFFSMSPEGKQQITSGEHTKLLGIYSGRINKDSDLGIVWKVSAMKELAESL